MRMSAPPFVRGTRKRMYKGKTGVGGGLCNGVWVCVDVAAYSAHYSVYPWSGDGSPRVAIPHSSS